MLRITRNKLKIFLYVFSPVWFQTQWPEKVCVFCSLIQVWRWPCSEISISHLTSEQFERWGDLPKATPQVMERIRISSLTVYPLVHACWAPSLGSVPVSVVPFTLTLCLDTFPVPHGANYMRLGKTCPCSQEVLVKKSWVARSWTRLCGSFSLGHNYTTLSL